MDLHLVSSNPLFWFIALIALAIIGEQLWGRYQDWRFERMLSRPMAEYNPPQMGDVTDIVFDPRHNDVNHVDASHKSLGV